MTAVATGIASIYPVHLRRTFALQAFGAFDPSAHWTDDTLTKCFVSAGGLCTVTIARCDEGLAYRAVGVDAASVIAQLVDATERDDGYETFAPDHPALAAHCRQLPGLRLIRVPWLFDIACSAILQQRVKSTDAMREWARICAAFGEKTTYGQAAFPSAQVLSSVPLHTLQSFGIDPRRARTLLALAKEVRLHPLRSERTKEHLRLLLSRVPGIGPWTVDMILGFGAADLDAVPVGDLYLPHLVSYALAGERRGSDERMLEILEPFRPNRFRVIRLLYSAGVTVPGWGAL